MLRPPGLAASRASVAAAQPAPVAATHPSIASMPATLTPAKPALLVRSRTSEAASLKRKRATPSSSPSPTPVAARAEPIVRRQGTGCPVPCRGKGVDSTAYLACSLCLDEFGTRTPVALTYLPTHLAKFHSELNGVYPPEVREHISAYRRARRLACKRRTLEKRLDPVLGTETLQAQGAGSVFSCEVRFVKDMSWTWSGLCPAFCLRSIVIQTRAPNLSLLQRKPVGTVMTGSTPRRNHKVLFAAPLSLGVC